MVAEAEQALNIQQAVAVSHLFTGSVSVNERGELQRDDFVTWLWRKVSPRVNDAAVQKIVDYVTPRLQEVSRSGQESSDLLELSRICIHKGSGTQNSRLKERLLDLDRKVFMASSQPARFQVKEQRKKYQKWVDNGFPPEVFARYPKFVDFVFSGLLHSCMAAYYSEAYPHTVRVAENGEPMLMVEGEYRPWSEFADRFEVRWSPLFHEPMVFAKAPEGTPERDRQVWTYLGGDKGLVPYNPFTFGELETITKITPAEVRVLQEKGAQFTGRPESDADRLRNAAERPCVLQVVSSNVSSKLDRNILLSGYQAIIGKPRHPWFRLVYPNGDVKIVGFGWEKEPNRPAMTVRGRFRAPDVWEFKPADRFVTNIAISEQEAAKFERYVQDYQQRVFHNQSEDDNGPALGFNILRHNCSVFVVSALDHVVGVRPDIEVDLRALIVRLLPTPVLNTTKPVTDLTQRGWSWLKDVHEELPEWAQEPIRFVAHKVHRLFEAVKGLLAAPLVLLAGGLEGETGVAFAEAHEEDYEQRIDPLLTQLKGWLTTQGSRLFMPGMLQKWQGEQVGATQRIRRRRELAIVDMPTGGPAPTRPEQAWWQKALTSVREFVQGSSTPRHPATV